MNGGGGAVRAGQQKQSPNPSWLLHTSRLIKGGEHPTGSAAVPLSLGAVHWLPRGLWSKDMLYRLGPVLPYPGERAVRSCG